MRLSRPILSRRAFVMELEPGVVMPADLSDYMVRHYFASSFRDQPEVRLARRLIRPGATVLDVGANVGFWSLLAGQVVGPRGRVIAFEPVPANFTRLSHAIGLNRMTWVECRPVAVSDRTGVITFYMSNTGNSALGSLACRDGIDRAIEVPTVPLDDVYRTVGLGRVEFLKVDVEGAERQVFAGATQLLGREDGPIVQFEACDDLQRQFGTTTVALKRMLADFGYRVFRCAGRHLAEVRVDEGHGFEDLFALKPVHLASPGIPLGR